ncbi:Uncharacterised protein [Mycobacteroides abscessus subsp. abscessus]|nr:Uncharacterised protein [Mycobacteroides abscessus subsp. abscessus]SKU92910.1 Uncharacterised protein [Mycobacteroides abscessus subsp. abscessus]
MAKETSDSEPISNEVRVGGCARRSLVSDSTM